MNNLVPIETPVDISVKKEVLATPDIVVFSTLLSSLDE